MGGIYVANKVADGAVNADRVLSVAELTPAQYNAALKDATGTAFDVTAAKLNALSASTGIAGLALTDVVSVAKTYTAASGQAAERLVRSEVTVTPATTVTFGSASIVGVRGCVTVTTGKEVTDGFLYGVQGKFVGDGATLSVGSGHIAAVLAQMSGSGMTATDGHIAPLIVSGQNLPTSANVNMIYLESGGGKVNAILQSNVKATYAFDINNFESGGLIAAAGVGSGSAGQSGGFAATKVLVCLIDGVAAYIPLCSTNA